MKKSSRPPRTYFPIWKELKSKGIATVSFDGDAKLRERIIKAVIKEKDMDVELKQISPKKLWAERLEDKIIFHLMQA